MKTDRSSFTHYFWRQFKQNKGAYASLYFLAFLMLIAILAPVIANDRPLLIKYQKSFFFPAFTFRHSYQIKNSQNDSTETIDLNNNSWNQFYFETVIWAPIRYSPWKSDFMNANFTGPFEKQKFLNPSGLILPIPLSCRHWLGTGQRGNDLLAGLIYGTRVSITVGFISMGIAAFIGLILGSLAGFFGDRTFISTRGEFWMVILGICAGWFYGIQIWKGILSKTFSNSFVTILFEAIFILSDLIVFIGLFTYIGKWISKLPFLKNKIYIPVDSIISRLIEILVSLPVFMLILSLTAILKPSILNVILIIGFTSWTVIARLTRAEMLRVRNQEYIQSARALGYSQLRILLRHALPNAISPAIVTISFGIANAILLESSLSFLGVGVPHDLVTWGSLLNDARGNYHAWWMVIFPGLMIFSTVTGFNLIGEGLRDAFDPKLKK
ncbi:MAG: ABC transporter permease [Chitinophagales bacterium]|nr:ABC transporter permease [Chitinophagales bacterium]